MSDRLFAIFLFANFVVLTNSHDHDNKITAIFATVISLMSKKYVCHFDNQTKLHMNLFLQSSLHKFTEKKAKMFSKVYTKNLGKFWKSIEFSFKVFHFSNQTKLHLKLFLQSSFYIKLQSCFLKFVEKCDIPKRFGPVFILFNFRTKMQLI